MEKAFTELRDALVSYGHDEGYVFALEKPKMAVDNGVEKELTASFRMVPNPDGLSAEEVFFRLDAPLVGVSPDAYGHKIELEGRTVEVCGVNPRARKYSLIVRDLSDGKQYKVPHVVLD